MSARYGKLKKGTIMLVRKTDDKIISVTQFSVFPGKRQVLEERTDRVKKENIFPLY